MSIRHTAKARRRAAAVLMAVTLTLTAAACGDDGGKETDSSSSAKPSRGEEKDDGQPDTGPDTSKKLAEVKGKNGMVLTIFSAERDSAGFVTVNGQIENTTGEDYYGVSQWRGNEQELVSGGGFSVGGATLVDKQGKKRYYVLRDTEGRCLCTSGFDKVAAEEPLQIFTQFPAPPESTGEVEFQMPDFPSVTIEIGA